MGRTLKIVAVGIGLAALTVLAIFGFAIWVFIPLLPAGIIFVISVATLKRRSKTPVPAAEDSDFPKAA